MVKYGEAQEYLIKKLRNVVAMFEGSGIPILNLRDFLIVLPTLQS